MLRDGIHLGLFQSRQKQRQNQLREQILQRLSILTALRLHHQCKTQVVLLLAYLLNYLPMRRLGRTQLQLKPIVDYTVSGKM